MKRADTNESSTKTRRISSWA